MRCTDCPARSPTGECERMIGPYPCEVDEVIPDTTVTPEEKRMLCEPWEALERLPVNAGEGEKW